MLFRSIARDRALLDARITERVEAMWEQGLVDEVRALRERGMSRTASGALGYRQILEALTGDRDMEMARQRTIDGTRRFARRQDRRFRQDARIRWIEGSMDPLDVALGLLPGP